MLSEGVDHPSATPAETSSLHGGCRASLRTKVDFLKLRNVSWLCNLFKNHPLCFLPQLSASVTHLGLPYRNLVLLAVCFFTDAISRTFHHKCDYKTSPNLTDRKPDLRQRPIVWTPGFIFPLFPLLVYCTYWNSKYHKKTHLFFPMQFLLTLKRLPQHTHPRGFIDIELYFLLFFPRLLLSWRIWNKWRSANGCWCLFAAINLCCFLLI